MDQLGHTDPAFTLRVYRHAMRRDESAEQALARLVGAPKRHRKGARPWIEAGAEPERGGREPEKMAP
jgi:hypothetical protein